MKTTCGDASGDLLGHHLLGEHPGPRYATVPVTVCNKDFVRLAVHGQLGRFMEILDVGVASACVTPAHLHDKLSSRGELEQHVVGWWLRYPRPSKVRMVACNPDISRWVNSKAMLVAGPFISGPRTTPALHEATVPIELQHSRSRVAGVLRRDRTRALQNPHMVERVNAYRRNSQILQTPDYVVILAEMIHDARIIALDDRPRLSPQIRQWLRDSRAHWDGDTLVVETINFNAKGDERVRNLVLAGSEHSHLVERFRRVDADTIDYRFTLTDPRSFRSSWTAQIPMVKLGGPLFEYACHEGNYGLYNILAGARQQERSAAASKRSGGQ